MENAGGWLAEMIFLQRSGDDRIKAVDDRSEAKSGTDQTIGAGADAACSQAGAAGGGTGSCADSADAAAGRVLHHSGIDAEDAGSSFCAQHVGIGDIQVVARDGDVEVILQRKRNSVVQRKIQLAIVHELVDARACWPDSVGHMPRFVRRNRVGKMRYRLGIIQHRKRPCFRSILRDGRGGRFLAQAAAVQPVIVSIPNKIAAVVSRMFEAKRANGIYSSPFVMDKFVKTSSLRLAT